MLSKKKERGAQQADGIARAAITQYVESIDPFFSQSFDQTTSSHKSSDKAKKGKSSKSTAPTATEMDDDLPF